MLIYHLQLFKKYLLIIILKIYFINFSLLERQIKNLKRYQKISHAIIFNPIKALTP